VGSCIVSQRVHFSRQPQPRGKAAEAVKVLPVAAASRHRQKLNGGTNSYEYTKWDIVHTY
jgi:hypothetical protein